MNYYVPFSIKDGEHSVYDLITSIVGAEGIAPTAAAVFNGIEAPRSSPPPFTGLHPLNPFKDRLLVYDRIPLLESSGQYASIRENTVYVCVEADTIEFPVENALRKVDFDNVSSISVYETMQAMFFSNPAAVSVLFVSSEVYDKCRGCLGGVNVKNEQNIGYKVLSTTDIENAITLTDNTVRGLEFASGGAEAETYAPSWRMEAVQGAALCYHLVVSSVAEKEDTGEGDWNRIVGFKDWLASSRYANEGWPGRERVLEAVVSLTRIPNFVQKGSMKCFSRAVDFSSYDSMHRKLIERFVDVAVSLKMTNWNWSDNECRASLAGDVMTRCIIPVMQDSFPPCDVDRKIEMMGNLISMIERKFREPNTYEDFNEDNLNSGFVRALYRFLSTEGRLDRILESLGAESCLDRQVREMLASMYGAFKGYAQVSVKRFLHVLTRKSEEEETGDVKYEENHRKDKKEAHKGKVKKSSGKKNKRGSCGKSGKCLKKGSPVKKGEVVQGELGLSETR